MRKSFMRKGAAAVIAALMVLSVGSAYAQTQAWSGGTTVMTTAPEHGT